MLNPQNTKVDVKEQLKLLEQIAEYGNFHIVRASTSRKSVFSGQNAYLPVSEKNVELPQLISPT